VPGLTLSRRPGEQLLLSGGIVITVVSVDRNKVLIRVEAPPEVRVDRAERLAQPAPAQTHRIIQCPDCKGKGGEMTYQGHGNVDSSVCDTCSGKGVIAVVPDGPASGQGREGGAT
jgi:carbon storage regulator CsrA